MSGMCTFLQVSRAAYYAWLKRVDQPDLDVELIQLIQRAYKASRQTYGYRRVGLWIRRNTETVVNHKAVLRLMRKKGIRTEARKPKQINKWKDLPNVHIYPNVLNRNFTASRPNQKWATDITLIKTTSGWAYLSMIKDLFDGFIVAHKLSRRNNIELVTDTLKLAKQKEMVTDELILHSDQGFQYTTEAYFTLLKEYNITPSMSSRGKCSDNACAENFFGHLKEESIRRFPVLPTFEEVKIIVDDYIHFYNYERLQLKTKQTPFQLRCLYQ